MKKEFLGFKFKVEKAEDNGKVGYIEGYASTFGNVDLGMDIVDRGAFSKTIKDKSGVFPILLDHDPTKPAGWNKSAEETDRGLLVKGELTLVSPEVQHRYELAKKAMELGAPMGLSIGYSVIKAEPDFKNPIIRHLKEVKLYEYSLVTFPMNEEANVSRVKSEALAALFAQLQKHGYDENKLREALAKAGITLDPKQAAAKEIDPAIVQSVDNLIQKIRASI